MNYEYSVDKMQLNTYQSIRLSNNQSYHYVIFDILNMNSKHFSYMPYPLTKIIKFEKRSVNVLLIFESAWKEECAKI